MQLVIKDHPITLDTIANGALERQFNAALQDVIANVKDFDTDSKKRDIIIKFSFTPGDTDREDIDFSFQVLLSLRPRLPYEAALACSQSIMDDSYVIYEAVKKRGVPHLDNPAGCEGGVTAEHGCTDENETDELETEEIISENKTPDSSPEESDSSPEERPENIEQSNDSEVDDSELENV